MDLSSSNVENMPSPMVQRRRMTSSSSILASSDRLSQYSLSFWNPWSTHRKRPPAVYWVNEYRSSPFWIATLECRTTADGRRIVDPGGNSITSLRSHKTRCPPCLGSKGPRDVTAHHLLGRLAGSVWENKTVDGPKLKVEHVKTVAKFRRSCVPYQSKREVTWSR